MLRGRDVCLYVFFILMRFNISKLARLSYQLKKYLIKNLLYK